MPTPPNSPSEPARRILATARPGLWVCTVDGATRLIEFGRSVLAFRDSELAYEFGRDLGTVRQVDLAGAHRRLMGHPRIDPITDELHLLTYPSDDGQLHVSVSPGGLTRTIRSIPNAPGTIRELEVTLDHVVLLADGGVGVTDRTGEVARTTWYPVDTRARQLASAHAPGNTIVVHATGPSLVRWTLHRRSTTVDGEVLDQAPHSSPRSNRRPPDGSHRYLWTVGSGAAHKHDLVTGAHWHHDFGSGRHPGELAFVADPDRPGEEDGGWIVGFVHDAARNTADLVVLDAQHVERPAAVVQVPGPVPTGAWIPVSGPADPSVQI
jgi:carotenoid cleavage dioxygenase-like enzyme